MGPQGVGLEDSQTGGLYRGHRTAGGLQDRSKSPLILCTKSDIRVQLSDEDDPHQILKSGPKYLPWFLLQAFFNEYTHTRASNSACPTDPTRGSYCHHDYPRWQQSVVFAIFFLPETPSHNSSPSTFSNRKSRRPQLHFVNLPGAKASKSSRAILHASTLPSVATRGHVERPWNHQMGDAGVPERPPMVPGLSANFTRGKSIAPPH